MGWMNDTLRYIQHDPVHRSRHHHDLTFGITYAYTENFLLPVSHDEVVHGKGSLLRKMPGDDWQRLANVRAYLAFMWAHPGKQMLFMGQEFAQDAEWSHDRELSWTLLRDPRHNGIRTLVKDLNEAYRAMPALWRLDSVPTGFRWIDADAAGQNVCSFLRMDGSGEILACITNFSAVPLHDYPIQLPASGPWHEVLNTDAACYGGGNLGNLGSVYAEADGALITIPPLASVWLRPAITSATAAAIEVGRSSSRDRPPDTAVNAFVSSHLGVHGTYSFVLPNLAPDAIRELRDPRRRSRGAPDEQEDDD
jgi:1,4-alpha-glucan branching enzyme